MRLFYLTVLLLALVCLLIWQRHVPATPKGAPALHGEAEMIDVEKEDILEKGTVN